jgi:hypothetical protein
MTADTVVLERALMVMAICMAIQTLMFMGVAIGAFIAWRRASAALVNAKEMAESHVAELRGHIERISATVEDTAAALKRGSATVDGVMTDVRDAMGTVRNSVGTVASVVTGPRTALALGLLKGLQSWRKRRDVERIAATATSEL